MAVFNILVYANVVRGNALLANWTQAASGLVFRSNAFGGFGSCEFDLMYSKERLLDIVIGTGQAPGYILNRIRITDQLGSVCYEGLIYDLSMTDGSDTVSRSANELFTVARADYTAKGDTLKYNVTNAALTSNVATLVIGAHPFAAGDVVSVSNVSASAVYNGDYTLTGVNATEISYDRTNSNLGSSASSGKVKQRTGGGTVDRFVCYANEAKRGLYGTRPHYQTLEATFPLDSATPLQIATRVVTRHKNPSKPQGMTIGGSGNDLRLRVGCVGLSADLNARQAWNENAATADTALIVREMIEGSGRAAPWSWVGLNGWYERLVTPGVDGDIPYPPEFIKQQFGQLTNSGVSISRSIVGQGQSRWDVIKGAAAYGSSNDRRMLCQVWEDRANSGQGKIHFVEQPAKRATESGYVGLYHHGRGVPLTNSDGQVVPLWGVRAGQWLTTYNMPAKAYGGIESPFDDPRMIWLEEVEYSVDDYVLTLNDEFTMDAEILLGKVLANGKQRIKQAPPATTGTAAA